jgi:hypothetical protein
MQAQHLFGANASDRVCRKAAVIRSYGNPNVFVVTLVD